MNKTILSIAVGVVFFLAFSHSDANVCTAISAANNLNGYRKTSQGLVTISNDTDQCKFSPTNNNNNYYYYTRDTYRTNNLNTRSEGRRVIRVDGKVEERRSVSGRVIRVNGKEEERRSVSGRVMRVDGKEEERRSENQRVSRVDGKEEERRSRFRIDGARRVRLTRSESLPDIRRECIRGASERCVVDVRDADRRVLERSDRRFLENYRSDRRTFRREVRDSRDERQTSRDDTDTRRRVAEIRQSNMVAVKDNDASTSWPFSSFVQSTIGVLGLYYFGMHNKSTK